VGPQSERAQATLAELRERFPDLQTDIAQDVSAAARRADLIVCLTSARIHTSTQASGPGTTISAVGSDTTETQELSTELLASATLVCDITHQCGHSGELHHALEAGVITAAGRAITDTPIVGVAVGHCNEYDAPGVSGASDGSTTVAENLRQRPRSPPCSCEGRASRLLDRAAASLVVPLDLLRHSAFIRILANAGAFARCDIRETSHAVSEGGVVSPCPGEHVPNKTELREDPAKATLSSRTMATITTAARTISSYNASPGGAFGARWREARRGGLLGLRSAETDEVALMALERVERRDLQ
jgi:hypothetical protein